MNNYKISCVMTTYRRFTCVERSIVMFLNQDCNRDRELIIFNTDVEYPLVLSETLKQYNNIIIVNNNIDYTTKETYNNIGSIRRDAITHATGTHYICWDDDDVFLPWYIRQCINGIQKHSEAWAWKPEKSFWWDSTGNIKMASSSIMEASIISRLDKIREYGFKEHKGGGEHWNWLNAFMHNDKLTIDLNSVPSYCFNWSDQGVVRGHKQSSSINHPDNFNVHKENTKDFANRNLEVYDQNKIKDINNKFITIIKENINKPYNTYNITPEVYNTYVQPHE